MIAYVCMYVCMLACVGVLLPACNTHLKARSAPTNTTPNGSVQLQGGGTPTVNVNFNGPGSIVTQVKLDVSLYDIKTTCTTGNVDWELFDTATRIAEDKSTDNPNIYKKLNCTVEKTFNLKITSTGTEPTSATIVFKPTYYYDFVRTYRDMVHPITGETMNIVDKMLIVSFKNAPEMTDPLPDGVSVPPIGDPDFAVNDPDVRAFINQADIRVMYLLPALKTLFVTPEVQTVEEAIVQWPAKFPQIDTVEPVFTDINSQGDGPNTLYVEKPLRSDHFDNPPPYYPNWSVKNYHWNLWDKSKWAFEEEPDYAATWGKYEDKINEKVYYGIGAYRSWYFYDKPFTSTCIAVIDTGIQRFHCDLNDNLTKFGINIAGDSPKIMFTEQPFSGMQSGLPFGPAGDVWQPKESWQKGVYNFDDLKYACDWGLDDQIAHGTLCAGLISALVANQNTKNETVGIAGATNNLTVLPVALSPSFSTLPISFTSEKLLLGLYAVGIVNGTFAPPHLAPVVGKDFIIPDEIDLFNYLNFCMDVRVVNISLAYNWCSDAVEDAVRLLSKTTILVCAAGNSAKEDSAYPAKYSSEFKTKALTDDKYKKCYVLSVGATDYFGYQAVWSRDFITKDVETGSNYGSTVDVSAPGFRVLTTDLTTSEYDYLLDIGCSRRRDFTGLVNWDYYWQKSNPNSNPDDSPYLTSNYAFFNGTSAAAPHVAALAGILTSIDNNGGPNGLDNVVNRIITTCNSLPIPEPPRKLMPPIVNFYKAINGF